METTNRRWTILGKGKCISSKGNIVSVKQFPYIGKRTNNPPSIQVTKTGAVIFKNDIFGMTIWQFEKKYKECLSRRTKNYQIIQGIVVPCYKRNCDGLVRVQQQSPTHRNFVKKLIAIIGTSDEIKLRQRMFMIQNYFNRYGDEDSIPMFTGSLSEGIDLPGSDEDEMLICKFIRVLDRTCPLLCTKSDKFTDVIMDTNKMQPGFARLIFPGRTRHNAYIDNSLVEHTNIVSSSKFRHQFVYPGSFSHGPCVSYGDGSYDFAICLFCPHWPTIAESWKKRARPSNWPAKKLVIQIIRDGCLLVPIGPKFNDDKYSQWRISFSMGEKRLMLSMNHAQILCYGLLKILLKESSDSCGYLKDFLCSYYLKSALFWLSEEIPQRFWVYENIIECYNLLIDKLITWTRECYCPNYFIPENNMFLGKINCDNNLPLLVTLSDMRSEGLCLLRRCPSFARDNINTLLPNYKREAKLDLLAFRTIHPYPFDSVKFAYKTLRSVFDLIESEQCNFIRQLCIYFKAVICKQIPQLIDTDRIPGNKQSYKKMKEQEKHLLCGIKADFGSGWLLYASFLYRQGKYRDVLTITEYILGGIKPEMMRLRNPSYTEEERQAYCEIVCGKNLTLQQKQKIMALNSVTLNDKSYLMPAEFALEANIRPVLMAPPIVYIFCLQWLAYHRLNDFENANKTLRSLENTVKERNRIERQYLSHSLTLLGVCCQLNGDIDLARQYFREASNTLPVCKSVNSRLKTLNEAFPSLNE